MTYSFMNLDMKLQIPTNSENIAKATTDPRLECSYQSNFFRSYYKVLIKFHLLNLDQASTSKSQTNISIKILTKVQLCTELTLQNLNQSLFSKPEQKISIKK